MRGGLVDVARKGQVRGPQRRWWVSPGGESGGRALWEGTPLSPLATGPWRLGRGLALRRPTPQWGVRGRGRPTFFLPHDKWCQRWNSLVQAASTLGLERPSRTRPRTHPQALALVLPGPQPQHHSGWVFCELWVSQPLGSPSSHQHGWTHTHTRHHMYHHLAQEAASEQLHKPEGEVPSRRFVSCKQETDSLSLPLKDE